MYIAYSSLIAILKELFFHLFHRSFFLLFYLYYNYA